MMIRVFFLEYFLAGILFKIELLEDIALKMLPL